MSITALPKRSPRDDESHREFLLMQLRALTLRARLTAAELDSLGCALKGGFITPEGAIAWLADLGLSAFIDIPKNKEAAA